MGIVPAHLAFADDGTPYSEEYGDVYHAAAGGPAQAEHVFLGGNDLPQRWRGRRRFVILETGFGLGLNFLATWAAWRADARRPTRLHYLAVEKHPFARADLALLHARHPQLAAVAAQLQTQWPVLTAGFHRLEFEAGGVTLTLVFGEAIAAVTQFVAEVDAIYLDGFAPAKNPDMWSPALLREIALTAAPGATLATWSVAAGVRDALAGSGFVLERRPGFGHKREMLVGHLPGPAPADPAVERRAAVIGAGLAGCLVAERLAARGWQVDIFDRQPAPARETSGNLTAVMLPVLSLDDARLSRLNRSAYLYALRWLAAARSQGRVIAGASCGVLQLARDAAHAEKLREILVRNAFPNAFVRLVDQAAAGELAGLPVAGPGCWFADGAWANPAEVCAAALAQQPRHVTRRLSTRVSSLTRLAQGWQLRGQASAAAGDGVLGSYANVVLAGALDITTLAVAAHLPLFRFRGQVSHVPAGRLDRLGCVVCREGYVTPNHAGVNCVGASFQRGGDAALRDEDHAANLARLEAMLPGTGAGLGPAALAGRVGFRPVSPDKLPIVGALHAADAVPSGRNLAAVPRRSGLHVATGYGARGLVWAPLMAELLASQLEHEPLPIGSDLAGAVDPARFVGRATAAASPRSD